MFLATALAKSRYSTTKEKARKANVGILVIFAMCQINWHPTAKELAGFDDRDQKWSRRRRWATAYLVSCRIWGLAIGTIWHPCYMCGDLFHAWTMDADHVHPFGGSHPTNLLLGCATCNRRHKGDRLIPNNAAQDLIASHGMGVGYAMGGKSLLPMWDACERRVSAKGVRQNSRRYPGA